MLHRLAERGPFRGALVLGVATLAVATCRTPPPLPSSSASEQDSTASGPSAGGRAPVASASPAPAAAEAADETSAPKDFSAEHVELVERYAKKRPLSTLRGEASYYGRSFAGRKTASGETFEPERFTAAHRSLPFGTVLRVTRVGTKSVVYVRVNDRGPFGKKRRILDLSEAAAGELGMLRDGVCEVRVEVLERGKP